MNSTYFVKGDPNNMIAGARTNPQSPTTDANLSDWEQLHMISFTEMVEREVVRVNMMDDYN